MRIGIIDEEIGLAFEVRDRRVQAGDVIAVLTNIADQLVKSRQEGFESHNDGVRPQAFGDQRVESLGRTHIKYDLRVPTKTDPGRYRLRLPARLKAVPEDQGLDAPAVLLANEELVPLVQSDRERPVEI